MFDAGSLFFIIFFIFFLQGLNHALIGIVLYALLSRLPLPAPGRAAVALGGAAVLVVAFAFGSSQMGYVVGAITLMLMTPLMIAAPLLVLAARERHLSCARYPVIFGALFLGAATGNVLQIAIPSRIIAALAFIPTPGLFLIRMAIIGIMYIVLTAGWFVILCELLSRQKNADNG